VDSRIGIYVINGANFYDSHGLINKPFGSIGVVTITDPDTGWETIIKGYNNINNFVNDRNSSLFGGLGSDLIYWSTI
jgi:hypothetical protein